MEAAHSSVWLNGGMAPPLLTLILDRGEYSVSRPYRYTPSETTHDTSRTGRWVDPRAVLGVTEIRKSLVSVVQPVACSLYQSLPKHSTKLLFSSYADYHKGRHYLKRRNFIPKDNIKINLKTMIYEGVDCIQLV